MSIRVIPLGVSGRSQNRSGQTEFETRESELKTENRMEESAKKPRQEFVFRISVQPEWEELQTKGSTLGADLDRSTGCIHLSDLNQVKMVLANFFAAREDLYLLQIDAAKLGEGLVYESADGTNYFPHFYGPERSFVPLPLDSVTKAEKLVLVHSNFTCSLLD